jgi:histidinol-phosphate aminotransferase
MSSSCRCQSECRCSSERPGVVAATYGAAPEPTRRLSRRAFGKTVAAASAATWGAALLPSALEAAALPVASGTAVTPLAAAGGMSPIRIGSNENPYGLGPSATAALTAAAPEANRYPNASIMQLMGRLAEVHGVTADSVMLAPGSGDILRAVTLAFTAPGKSLVAGSPTFEAPGRTAKMVGAPIVEVPVLPSGSLDLDAMAAKASGSGLYFICNPNNPTGGVNSAASIAEFIARVRKASPDAYILVDEAYFEFAEDPAYGTAVPLAKSDPHVIVSRTFSKIHGMAGLRVGYAIAHPDTLAAMRRAAGAGSISGPSASAALASLNDVAHMKEQIALNNATRKFTIAQFEGAGFSVLPSQANFVMVDVKRPVGGFQAACRESGVMIARPFPPLATHARVTIGTMDEMKRAMAIMLPLLQTPASARLADIPAFSAFDPVDPSDLGFCC